MRKGHFKKSENGLLSYGPVHTSANIFPFIDLFKLDHFLLKNHCLLLGLPPVAVDTPKKYGLFVYFMYLHVFYLNFFNFSLMGKAFEQAAENTQTEITSVFFDSSGTRFVYFERNLNTYCRFYLQLLRSIPRIGAVS